MDKFEGLIHLTGSEISSIHDTIIDIYGGLKGSRPDLSIDTIVWRIHSNIIYAHSDEIEIIAALYAEAICKGHVFNDGNKRTALLSMLTFLDTNGYNVLADNIDIADKIVEISENSISRDQFASWLRVKLVKS